MFVETNASCVSCGRSLNAAFIAATVSVGSVVRKPPAYNPPATGWSLRCCFFVWWKMLRMFLYACVSFLATSVHVASAFSLKSGFVTRITDIGLGWPLRV